MVVPGSPALEKFGCPIQFTEPSWYQGSPSPYYKEGHAWFRETMRKFVEEELKPHMEEWIASRSYPMSLHKRAYELGIQGILYPNEYGGTQPDDFDTFYEIILWDELARVGGGAILGQMGINSMALPPIILAGSQEMKDNVLRPVIRGDKSISLAISEPSAGSDVAAIKATATRNGDFFVVNGYKKWITGGLTADFFTVAVRTGGPGMDGISLLLLEKAMSGISIRRMDTQFDSAHNTTFIEFNNVQVPCKNLIGLEGSGFGLIMHNFNHERFVIAITAIRGSRLCYELAFKYALKRKTFGKYLINHQLIRFKLAEMARQIEALQDNLERVAYCFSRGVDDHKLGSECALLKVHASKAFEYCAREASQIFGGNSIVKEGQGKIIERLYREVRGSAIPGGSEEILLDFAIRHVASKVPSYL